MTIPSDTPSGFFNHSKILIYDAFRNDCDSAQGVLHDKITFSWGTGTSRVFERGCISGTVIPRGACLTELDMSHHIHRNQILGISPYIHLMIYAKSGMKLSAS
jgi:hypothetical protein